ncbi:MAG: LuxR C-terminal-related transcriptional regulator [Dysgonomonas sp.]
MRNLIIADKQDITSAGIKFIVENLHLDFSKISEANSKIGLIESLKLNSESVVILDYSLFDFSSPEEVVITKSRFKDSFWIIFSEELSDPLLKRFIYNEKDFSIILKSSSLEEIVTALSFAEKGKRFICEEITNHLLNTKLQQSKNEEKRLTSTEKEILKSIAEGKTTKEIAFERSVSIHTIISHRKNLFRKLEVNNVHEATKYAIRAGIIDIADYYI